jgi:hypothetical protein
MLLGVIAKGAAAIEDIIMDPVGFLGNLFSAMKLGLDQFLGNIGQHLINGLLSWMLGPLSDLGIRIPKELSLSSVFDLVLQILGITGAKLRQKAEKLIGKKAVDILEKAWTYISALIEGGPAKLWEVIKDQLSGLWDSVIGGITSWITTEIVEAGIAWIAKLSNPVGAVIEAIRQIYNVVSFVVGQANKIIAFADAVVSSLSQIVHGEIAGAANWIEQALGRTVPLVIEFLAGLVGISSPAPEIRGIVEKIQGTVDKALDWLVEKAKAIGQGLLSALGLGGKQDDQPAMPDAEVTEDFDMAGEGHTLTARVKNGELEILMASGFATRIQSMLHAAIEEVKKSTAYDPHRKRFLLFELELAQQNSNENSIRQDWRAAGSAGMEEEEFLDMRLAKVVTSLVRLSKHGIKSLNDFLAAPPEKRYLPAGYDVRAKLYERGSGWGTTRKNVVSDEKPPIRQFVRYALSIRKTAKAEAMQIWQLLKREEKILDGADLDTYKMGDLDRTEYHVDHILPLSLHWKQGGSNGSGDSDRWDITVNRDNLHLITKEANLKKGGRGASGERGEFEPVVGPGFKSKYAEGGIDNAKTIDGQPFTDAAGTPIR